MVKDNNNNLTPGFQALVIVYKCAPGRFVGYYAVNDIALTAFVSALVQTSKELVSLCRGDD